MVRFVLSLTIVLAVTSTATARNLYVNNLTGNDLNFGTSDQPAGNNIGPVRTIGKALRLARKGDRIVIANTGEPYRESVTLQAGNNSGWPDAPFHLEGNGATLDGSAAVPDHAWEHFDGNLFRFQPDRTAHHQLFRDGVPLARVHVPDYGELPDLEPLQWCLLDRYVYFRPEAARRPQTYRLTHSEQRVGITLYQVRHVVVSDLTVQGYQLDGINCHSNVHDGTLVGLVSRGNGRSGVSIGGASRVTLAASLIGNNGTAQLRVEGLARVVLRNNNLLSGTAPPLVNEGATVIHRHDAPADDAPADDAPADEAAAPEAPADDAAVPDEPLGPPAEPANPFSF
jgi:hypothetical protein